MPVHPSARPPGRTTDGPDKAVPLVQTGRWARFVRRVDRRSRRVFNFLPRGLFTWLSALDEQIETLVENWRDLENPRES